MSSSKMDVSALADQELQALVVAGQNEIAARAKRHKEETIAKIRALAGEAGLAVSINGARGRPGGARPPRSAKTEPEKQS